MRRRDRERFEDIQIQLDAAFRKIERREGEVKVLKEQVTMLLKQNDKLLDRIMALTEGKALSYYKHGELLGEPQTGMTMDSEPSPTDDVWAGEAVDGELGER